MSKLIGYLRHLFSGLSNITEKNQKLRLKTSAIFAEQNGSEDEKNAKDSAQGNGGGRQKPTGEEGPPDLDVLWNDFNRRLGSLFGSKGTKAPDNSKTDEKSQDRSCDDSSDSINESKPNQHTSGGKGSNGGWGRGIPNKGVDIKIPKIGFGLILLGIITLWLASGFFIVQEGQAGVVLQFGKYKYTAKPGINWRLPYPIQTTEIVNLSGVRSVEIGRPIMIQATNLKDSSMLTEDENIIDVKFAVQYRLKDPTEYLFNNRDPDASVVQAAETAVREIVGKSKMDTVLYEGREKIAIDLAASIQKILDSYKLGVLITSVTVQNVQPPEQVQASFDDAVKAGQDQERLKNEGQAYANEIIPRAKGTAARLIEEAQGYKAKVVGVAEGDASRFKQIYVEYAKAPQVTKDRMYIDSMQQIFSNVSKVMVDSHNGSQLLYLPLDKLIQQSTPEAAISNSGTVNSTQLPSGNAPNLNPSSSQPSNLNEKRDTLRSRERDVR